MHSNPKKSNSLHLLFLSQVEDNSMILIMIDVVHTFMFVCMFIRFGAVSKCHFVFTWSMSDSFYLHAFLGVYSFMFFLLVLSCIAHGIVLECNSLCVW